MPPASLIINSPYDPPSRHWEQARDGTLAMIPKRRPAGYEIFDVRNNTRRTEELKAVNETRQRLDAWREADCPGITSITRKLLEHWHDRAARQHPFYFCQLEAIETLIWWVEAAPEFKQGIFIPGDGGAWQRLCNKMATGSGKTAVMAMIITWQVLNALTYPKRNKDFSRAIFIVAPGLTVKERLRVLYPGEPDNDYDTFGLCPSEALRQKLNQAELLVENWHALMPLKEQERSVVKKGGEPPPPPKPSTQIEALPERNDLEIRWPNVLRVDTVVKPVLTVDWGKVEPLTLDPAQAPISVEIAPALGGATDWSRVEVIDLERLPEAFRLQRLIFQAGRKAYENTVFSYQFSVENAATKNPKRETNNYLVFQLIRLVEQFFASDKLVIPSLFHQDPLRKRILLSLSIDVIVQHLLRFVREQNTERHEPVFDEESPIGSTQAMSTWHTTKPSQPTRRSQISHVMADSAWEQYAANVLEKSGHVLAYAKNDHLGYQIYYLWNGARRRFIPDFLIRLANGKILVLEIKGEDSEQNRSKRAALDAWVKGVNTKGGFGVWCWDVAFQPAQIHDLIEMHMVG